MGSEYERKFEEMKMYIPFLENMIKRLESNSTASANPRQAQLDKIRSLRDLLLDKNKRMKMDNLLKCEQVLVNLYAKVEKKDIALPLVDNLDSRTSKDSSDLEAVRNKLKNVAKIQSVTETLPEIARASEREEICEPGSKEPALFQRRPNRSTVSPTEKSPNKSEEMKSHKSHSKRYTRVLLSPEPRTSHCWSGERSDDTSNEKTLFSRRSPVRSSRKNSQPSHKKDKKKKEKKTSKDLNITLKVPEESLHSLNTEDILSRIITCSDGDVDIDTLRELRSQILGELKQTGTNDDISELILKSYNKKSKPRKGKKHEVEEGEISDSESEAIENIYGNLVVMDKDKKSGQVKSPVDKSNQQRKIQICLVINSDKEVENEKKPDTDLSESGVFENKNDKVTCLDSDTSLSPNKNKDKEAEQKEKLKLGDVSPAKDVKQDNTEKISTNPENVINGDIKPADPKLDKEESAPLYKSDCISSTNGSGAEIIESAIKNIDAATKTPKPDSNENFKSSTKLNLPNEPTKNIANFYRPLLGDDNVEKIQTVSTKTTKQSHKNVNIVENTFTTIATDIKKYEEECTHIPLLNEPTLPPKAKKDVLSEIDILQALKNEILSETMPLAASETDTPALHQPKITKVASAVEANTSNLHQPKITKVTNSNQLLKRRISIDNYKKKSETVAKSLFIKKRSKEKMRKKQSLKLTEKECERFNFPVKLSLDNDTDDISDDDFLDDDDSLSPNDIYRDLAPKSPDQDNFCGNSIDLDEPPAIIPVQPVQANVASFKPDIDMRHLQPPLALPQVPPPQLVAPPSSFSNFKNDKMKSKRKKKDPDLISDGKTIPLIDPRLRKDLTNSSNDSLNPCSTPVYEGTPNPTQFPNIPQLMALSMTPVYTPSYAPSMTPKLTPNARSYEVTPTHQSFVIEEPKQKHVYAPSFPVCDTNERDIPVTNEVYWEPNSVNSNEDHRSSRDGRNIRWEPGSSGSRESQNNYNPRNDQFFIDQRDGYNRSDCPPTPGPSFGWADCPGTPGSSFRDTPMTHSYPFGTSDCPSTPIHSLGRSDCPSTPSHPFGRSDRAPTPNHPFGRNECPGTPIHPFGRNEIKDPRLNRRPSEYESRTQHDGKDRGYLIDRNYNRSGVYKSHRYYVGSDSSGNSNREQHKKSRYPDDVESRYGKNYVYDSQRRFDGERRIGRNDTNFSNESRGRGFVRTRREPSLNRSLSRDDSSCLFTRNRDGRYDNKNSSNRDEFDTRHDETERKIGSTMSRESLGTSSRAQSVGRSFAKKLEYDNTLPGKTPVARSFTIDTRVNATFQEQIESGKGIQVFDYTFDARRQRAASVGRSLAHEISVGRNRTLDTKPADSPRLQQRGQRASSVGRVLVENKVKTFQEIKADFEAYRLQSTKTKSASKVSLQISNKKDESISRSRKDNFENQSISYKQNLKQTWYPRKNQRDPRMRKDQKERDKQKNRNDRSSSSHSWDRRNSGIVYSNDNIAKGAIMGSGFGVKNYKIPKIKRPDPEPEETDKGKPNQITISTKTDDFQPAAKKCDANKGKQNNNVEDITDINKTITPKTQSVKKNTSERLNVTEEMDSDEDDNLWIENTSAKMDKAVTNLEVLDKRVTRSSRKSDSFKNEELCKTKKRFRKNIIMDSDSEVETEKVETEVKAKNKKNIPEPKETSKMEPEVLTEQKQVYESKPSTSDKRRTKTSEEDTLDSSFAIDDIEFFSGNMDSDPVIHNINDLIADLDHDIRTKTTSDSFTDEIGKMMGSIDSTEDNTLGDISDFIEKDLSEINEHLKQHLTEDDVNILNQEIELVSGPKNTITSKDVAVEIMDQNSQKNDEYPSSESPPIALKETPETQATEASNEKKECEEKNILSVKLKTNNVGIVSTTDVEETLSTSTTTLSNKGINDSVVNKMDPKVEISDMPTPDTTIVKKVQPDRTEDSLPDSTIEIHSEIYSDVTSTRDVENHTKETIEPSSRKEVSAMESFGSLLSILQDKSKIKELLSMLGDQSGDSEKIKKKLEKLSEIVSDEEDTNDNTSKACKSSPANQSNVSLDSRVTQNEIAEIEKESQFNHTSMEKRETHENCVTEIAENNLVCKKAENEADTESGPATVKHIKSTDAIVQSNDPSKDDLTVNDQITNESNNDKTIEDHSNDDQNVEMESNQDEELNKLTIGSKKKRRGKGRGKKNKFNKYKPINKINKKNVRIEKPIIKKSKNMSRELQTLHEDIKEMFMSDDILNATGIRMCRLAKMVDNKRAKDTPPIDSEPVVLLKKCKRSEHSPEPEKKTRKGTGPKIKSRIPNELSITQRVKKIVKKNEKPKDAHTYKPGPKSKMKQKRERLDPYEFESDSVADTNTTKESDANSSDSENVSSSSEASFGSSEVLADIKKKPKKKRGSWQTGIIKPRHKKKKITELSNNVPNTPVDPILSKKPVAIPDMNCFTDKTYCFRRGISTYDCRLCSYSGTEIVNHYKKQHTHTEVPLSRMDPETARKAILQCEEINFQAISKIPSDKYTCRFCYKEFSRNRVALEKFFWHVVSTHTGEYKHLCYECVNVTSCPFNLDIPPPPKDIKGQLIGYICGKCNFTQISLENLKTHVIVRHNDEQTEVYTVNLGLMTNKVMKAMLSKSLIAEQMPRTLRSSRSNQSTVEESDNRSEITSSDRISETGSAIGSMPPKIEEPVTHKDEAFKKKKNMAKPGPFKSKLRFETDDQERSDETSVKLEQEENEAESRSEPSQIDDTYTEPLDSSCNENSELDQTVGMGLVNHMHDVADQSNDREQDSTLNSTLQGRNEISNPRGPTDVFDQPHFKLHYKENGSKEYVCCINGDAHYRTTLIISLKKHVQTKHFDIWDGYCCLCKVIVTLQGVKSSFNDGLTHLLDKHIDDFPLLENILQNTNKDSRSALTSVDVSSTIERTESPRSYIAVRPLADLIAKDATHDDPPMFDDNELQFPKIENVVSLGDKAVKAPRASPVYPTTSAESSARPTKPFQYEEVQAEVMSKKHRIVLDTMMPKEVLVRVFKCAGRFCSFTSDSAEDALVHASAHKQMGGEGALDCAYCNFDAAGNAIDLVMHVFKVHGGCQYSCVLCFYRAAADQLVGAHFLKAHGGTGKAAKVLRTTSLVASTPSGSSNMLSREIAVPYYNCIHVTGEGGCRYRTYTPGKFCEHLQQKHGSDAFHPCNLCEEKLPTPVELVQHLKSHGIKLYQCTWCVHGADTESEMLSHAATAHPMKNPQAYLRIITNKDGSTDQRVLPLVYLNKLKVPVEEVTPSKTKENPTKEAERSIDLEKLISSLLTETVRENAAPIPSSEDLLVNKVPDNITKTSDLTDAETTEATESLVSSQGKSSHLNPKQMSISLATSVVKDEPEEMPHTLNQRTEVVYCLDSDDEEATEQNNVPEGNSTKQDVIELSDDDPSDKKTQGSSLLGQLTPYSQQKKKSESIQPAFVKLTQNLLLKCPKCLFTFAKVQGYKRHVMLCCRDLLTYCCPHPQCSVACANTSQLIKHYNKDHAMSKKDQNAVNPPKKYYCGLCQSNSTAVRIVKKHMKEMHNTVKIKVSMKLEEDGTHGITLHRDDEMPGRKNSIEMPKKYGIHDIDKLPINPILESLVYCDLCEFSTKVRLNMVRHLQQHSEKQPVPQTAPINPVPHLETNEMYFDKMINLASSSAALQTDKSINSSPITPEAALRYPKFVPERQRHTCGAKGCAYISVDEEMLRCHWETLHSGTTDYHCVHCPPNQQLDTTRTLTAARILAHLKMHDVSLYACSSCSFYHYNPQLVKKHMTDLHRHRGGQVQVVREDGNPLSSQTPAAPTMDLKPWQCGLCDFKSMLRPELVEHCSKIHNTKMQFKCAYCPFRTSALENITKHQANNHSTRPEDVFYYYYREGTVPDDEDGTPCWQKQRQAYLDVTKSVKTEHEPDVAPVQPLPLPLPLPTTRVPIDLNLVKKEINDSIDTELDIEELRKQFGEFCEPNGIKFKCPLCKTVTEHVRDAMLSHLYEELKYRRWSCGLCAYKAFHRAGLNEHMASEHRNNSIEPSQLPINVNIEKWVSKLLDHQSAIIDKNKENFAKQKIILEKRVDGPSKVVEPPKPVLLSSDSELVQAFGPLGNCKNNNFHCPKCNFLFKDEDEMRNHMESELTKIRWCCTKCSDKFQTYHEAQFHCKSHVGLAARPREAIRDPSLRSAWVSAVILTQKLSMKPDSHDASNNIDLTDTSENSLLMVRYEEAAPNDLLKEISRKRPIEPDSDDDSLVICEPEIKRPNDRSCPYCSYTTKYKQILKEHILKHYNLKIMTCAHCDFNSTRKTMHTHLYDEHPLLPHLSKQTEIPNCLPSEYMKKTSQNIDEDKRPPKKIQKSKLSGERSKKNQRIEDDKPKKVCLRCEKSVPEDGTHTHTHDNKPAEFGDKGQVVVKCCVCLALRMDLDTMQTHYKEVHPDIGNTNYAYYKLQLDTREVHTCGICGRRFTFIRDLRIHHSAVHSAFQLSYKTVPYRYDEDSYEIRGKRKLDIQVNPPAKRVAKKSTSKLPRISNVAKKSTTKLPNEVSDSDSDEYSYYGTKSTPLDQYENVKTMMPMYNTMVEIGVAKLSGILNINPRVVIKDCNKS